MRNNVRSVPRRLGILSLLATLHFFTTNVASANSRVDTSGILGSESTYFFDSELLDEQDSQLNTVSMEFKYFTAWKNGDQRFVADVFYRERSTGENQSNLDLRDLYWNTIHRDWELNLGFKKLFWGVTEFTHYVDIVNQTDLLEDPFGDEKLGQPMVNLTLISDFGLFDFFILTGFRERTFPGEKSRLRPEVVVEADKATFEDSKEEKKLDFAVRTRHSIQYIDIAFSYFSGTDRSPEFFAIVDPVGELVLIPHYGTLQQSGIEFQWNIDSWILKWEGVLREKQNQYTDSNFKNYSAYTTGLEYTFFNLYSSGADIGLFLEYMYDDRASPTQTPFDNDVFAGFRWAANDEQDFSFFLGFSHDLEYGSKVWKLRSSRRFGKDFRISIDGGRFDKLNATEQLYSLRNDSYIKFELGWYFGL